MTEAKNRQTISVVVASYNSPETLELCLASLAEQPVTEVIVVDSSDRDPTPALGARFPKVKLRHFNSNMSIPQLRREGIREVSGDIVAITESWMVPSSDWVAALKEGHKKYPSEPAVGGTVDFPLQGHAASLLQWADYFSEYGRYMTPAEDGYAEELTGSNCSYKRWALRQCEELIEQAAWEPFLHARLKAERYRLCRVGRAVVHYWKPVAGGQTLRQRFHYGRWFAADRARCTPWLHCLLRAALSPAVPWVMLWRLWRLVSGRPKRRARFGGALGWLLLLYSAWSLGELCAYTLGSGSSRHRIY